uniref:Uncharacterized protein n=1 Tax=Heterorhabditis bacteriophora TaxID=37862 RepID=A0A1I7W772_HETBA
MANIEAIPGYLSGTFPTLPFEVKDYIADCTLVLNITGFGFNMTIFYEYLLVLNGSYFNINILFWKRFI